MSLKTNISVRKPFLAAIATASSVRQAAVGIVVISLLLVMAYTIPKGNGDRRLLWQVHDVDVLGLSLAGELQSEVEGSRAQFLRVLQTDPDSTDWGAEIALLRQGDEAVRLTSGQMIGLGGLPETWKQFENAWQEYRTGRDARIGKILAGKRNQAIIEDSAAGQAAFGLVESTLRNAKTSFDHASTEHIRETVRSLRAAAGETLLLLMMTILSLGLLLWMDWRRIRMQRELVQTANSLRASEDRFLKAYESASVGMGIFSLDGTVLSVNRAAERILGCEPGALLGTKVADFMAPEFRRDLEERMASLPTDEAANSYQVVRRVLRRDGSSVWVRNSVTLMRPEGAEPHFFSITEEITQQKEANDRLAYLANYDPITNLPNLHYFEQLLGEALTGSTENTDCLALLYVEIDSFDFVKGTFGRTVADEILGELGALLASFKREAEVIARLDDHVFGMMLKAAAYDEATLTRAADLQTLFHHFGEMGRHGMPLSASIGVAYSSERSRESGSLRWSGTDAETLLKYGRAAMLEARARGGDTIHVADPGLQERAAQRHQIESALLHGLRAEEFRVVFQPQFEISTGRLVRFEALCRWNSAELGAIPPDRFIPIAEQTGMISEIGRRVLLYALEQAKRWIGSGRLIGVAVNISPMQFMRPDFTDTITAALAQLQFPPALLELEITEGIFIRDLNVAVSRIRELQRLGLSIALDDFGTGYSSLSYLQRMPIDAVKLDRSFVRELTTDAATVSMVRSVLAMADALSLRVVTEGVETEQQLEILRTLGCNEAQGYLLGRPESAELALERVLESPMLPMGTLAQSRQR